MLGVKAWSYSVIGYQPEMHTRQGFNLFLSCPGLRCRASYSTQNLNSNQWDASMGLMASIWCSRRWQKVVVLYKKTDQTIIKDSYDMDKKRYACVFYPSFMRAWCLSDACFSKRRPQQIPHQYTCCSGVSCLTFLCGERLFSCFGGLEPASCRRSINGNYRLWNRWGGEDAGDRIGGR